MVACFVPPPCIAEINGKTFYCEISFKSGQNYFIDKTPVKCSYLKTLTDK